MKLIDFKTDIFSEFGEDGMIEHIFEKIGTQTKRAVEFGAGDSVLGSNVARLWKSRGWRVVLIEGDGNRIAQLTPQLKESAAVRLIHGMVTPETVDDIVADEALDFMVIDVDGNDYYIWEKMTLRPRVICIEFNPTVPSHLELVQEYDEGGMAFGASLPALIALGREKGYTFVGATHCNAFFVLNADAAPFADYETDPVKLFPLDSYTFLVTDYNGQALAAGPKMPWGVKVPYVGPEVHGTYAVSGSAAETMQAYEREYGTVLRWTQQGWPNISDPDGEAGAAHLLRRLMEFGLSPICIDITWVSDPEHIAWVRRVSAEGHYRYRLGGGVITLVRR